MTAAMEASLQNLRSSLLCGICNQIMKDASTLGCAHSFCYDCISKYTENKWTCPFPACNASVTSMKGNSDSYIKKNPQINDVVIALQRVEENVRAGPANWWEEGDNDADAVLGEADDNDEEEEEEVVDFAAMQSQSDNDNNTSDDDDDDESSTTKAYEPEKEKTECNKNEISIEQSLFPSDQSADAALAKTSDLPRFSNVSSIAFQHSQATESQMTTDSKRSNDATKTPQTATASQLDRILMSGDEKEATKPAAVEVQRSEKKQTPTQSNKKRKHSNTPAKENVENIEELKPKSRRSTLRVSFQPQPKVMLLKPSLTLSNTESRSIRKCVKDDMLTMLTMPHDDVMEEDNLDTGFDFDSDNGRELFLSMLSSRRDGSPTPVSLSYYAISTEKEYAFEEGVVVPRSFQFYLAVACGLPIVDISFLESQSKKKRLGALGHQRYPFPTVTDEKTSEEKALHVIGASNHNWYAPQKAISAAIERHSLWTKEEGIHASSDTLLPGTELLQNYGVILLGDFDQPSVSKRVAKRKTKSVQSNSDGSLTRGNITVLLQLCGATVYDVTSVAAGKQIKKGLSETQVTSIANTSPLGHPEGAPTLKEAMQACIDSEEDRKFIVMVKDKSDTKLGTDFIAQYKSFTTSESNETGSIDVVSCDWLFDCIGDFQVHKCA